ncbi:hypothetical protein HMPREF9098_2145 [Kingella denitrificans ATCC 33394]|uniref:Uncharacterized protein n=1 Tax=Kingella denitrificans ATCC 33394 TaxID=888741 RepID=F0F210_9NEIS|nr:hypothetical protein HMPREF9098_2145 [Kingella denitrificans ATCC 33394]
MPLLFFQMAKAACTFRPSKSHSENAKINRLRLRPRILQRERV